MGRLYCLRCFADVARGENVCRDCGYKNEQRERRRFWNRAPGLVAFEGALKIGVVYGALRLAGIVMSLPHGNRGAGWFMVTPLLVGMAGWRTVSTVTRRIHFRASIFWAAGFGLTALFLPTIGLLWLVPGSVALALIALLSGRWFRQWQERTIRERRARSRERRPNAAARPAVADVMARLYCLRCLGDVSRDWKHCTACGYRNQAWERKLYWNRVPALAAVELGLKIGVTVGALALFPLLLDDSMQRIGKGYFLATPVLLALLGWKTASKLTARVHFRASIFWAAAFAMTAVALPLLDLRHLAPWALAGLAISLLIGYWFERWKARLTSSATP